MQIPSIITWIIVIFSAITFLPLLGAQLLLLINPQDQKSKDLIIGKGLDWRDETHFRSAYAFAWADWLCILPLLIAGTIGVLLAQPWGYILYGSLGAISIYFSVVFWVLERKYTYPSYGAIAYYTYFWGFFLYWGIAALVYSIVRFV